MHYVFHRHKLYYASLNLKAGNRGVITDVCVPISRLPEIILKTREDVDSAGITGKHVANIKFQNVA